MEAELQEMEELLCEWNLPQLSATFREQEIIPEALDALTDAEIEMLIPKLGPRALFRKRLQAWLQTPRSSNAKPSEPEVVETVEEPAVNDTSQLAFSYVDEDENEVEVLNEVWLNEEVIDEDENYDKNSTNSDVDKIVFIEDIKPKAKNLMLANKEIEQPPPAKRVKCLEDIRTSAINQLHILGKRLHEIKQEGLNDKSTDNSENVVMEIAEQVASSEINVTSKIERITPAEAAAATSTQRRCQRIGHNWASLNVEELLLSTEAGRALLENYESNPVLDKRARYYLAEIIVTETFAKNLIMDRYKFENIAQQITQLFPTEEKESWYWAQKSSKKCSGGTLYYKYYATYTKMRKSGFYQHYVESVTKQLDSEASLDAEIEKSNYAVKLEDIGDDPYKEAFKRSIPRYERIRNSSDFERINVKEILEKSYEGLGIIDFYEKNGSLEVATRNHLCKIVCMEGINRNIKMQPCDFYDISCQIVELFPNEKHEVYFFPRGKTPPKGCLYHKYIYLIRRMKKMGLVKKEADTTEA